MRAHGVAALYLFGSYARDEARPDSDVDVFVDPADEDAFGLIPLFDSRAVVENTLAGMDIAYSTGLDRSALQTLHRARRHPGLLMGSAKEPRVRLRHI